MADTMLDTFHGGAGDLLADHTPDDGPPWVLTAGLTGELNGRSSTPWLNLGGAFCPQSLSATQPFARGPSPMPDANYSASCVVTQLSAGNGVQFAGLALRWDGADTFYSLVYSQLDQAVTLQKTVAGVGGTIGSYPVSLNDGDSVAIALTIVGTSLTATIDGVPQTPVTDADIAGPGSAALVDTNGPPSTATTGLQISQWLLLP